MAAGWHLPSDSKRGLPPGTAPSHAKPNLLSSPSPQRGLCTSTEARSATARQVGQGVCMCVYACVGMCSSEVSPAPGGLPSHQRPRIRQFENNAMRHLLAPAPTQGVRGQGMLHIVIRGQGDTAPQPHPPSLGVGDPDPFLLQQSSLNTTPTGADWAPVGTQCPGKFPKSLAGHWCQPVAPRECESASLGPREQNQEGVCRETDFRDLAHAVVAW